MSKKHKKRNVFNLPEELYTGILESVRNDPNLYVNPDPTVREDIHYLAYTLYAQRPSKQERAKNYIDALVALGNLCDEIEAATGYPVNQKQINCLKKQIAKEKEIRHAKEAERHKNDKDFFGNPKPYVHKYFKYEEDTEDTNRLVELLRENFASALNPSVKPAPVEEEEEEVVVTPEPPKKEEKKAEPPKEEEPWDGDLAKEFGFVSDSDEDEEDDDDDENDQILQSMGYSRKKIDSSLLEVDDDDDEDDDEDDEEEEDDEDDLPELTATGIRRNNQESSDDEDEDEDDDDVDLDSFDSSDDSAQFDAWLNSQNIDTNDAVVDMSKLASKDTHRLADTIGKEDADDYSFLDTSDDEDEDEDDESEEKPVETPKVEPEALTGVDPDEYHRKMMRALMDAKNGCPKHPEDNQVAKIDDVFKYFASKNPETIKYALGDLPAYAGYFAKYFGTPDTTKKEHLSEEFNSEDDILKSVKESAARAQKTTEARKASLNIPRVCDEDIIDGSIRTGATLYFKDENGEYTITELNGISNSRVRHDHVVYPPIKKEEPVKEAPKEEEPERDEITFAEEPSEEPAEATPEEEKADPDLLINAEDEDTPYYDVMAETHFGENYDNVFTLSDTVNTISINFDYLEATDDPIMTENDASAEIIMANFTAFVEWFYESFINFRPAVILTKDQFNSMTAGVKIPAQDYMCIRLGNKYVAGYHLDDSLESDLMEAMQYALEEGKLVSFFKKYIKIMSDLDGFSFLNTLNGSPVFDAMVTGKNNKVMCEAFIKDFRDKSMMSEDIQDHIDDADSKEEAERFTKILNTPDITFDTLAHNKVVTDPDFYNSIFEYVLEDTSESDTETPDEGTTTEPVSQPADVVGMFYEKHPEEESPDVKTEEPVEHVEAEVVQEPEPEDPKQELATAVGAFFTALDETEDFDTVDVVAQKVQAFVNKKRADAGLPVESPEPEEDEDEVEDDDDYDDSVEEYFPNIRKEVKREVNQAKSQNKNSNDGGDQSFVIRRR